MEKYDLIIVGAGPAGIFTAVELLRHGMSSHSRSKVVCSTGRSEATTTISSFL